MRAPALPGESEDICDGACVNCYCSGQTHRCECRSGAGFQQEAATPVPVMTSNSHPREENRKRPQTKAIQKPSSAPHPEDENAQGDLAQTVPAHGEDVQDPKHRLQDDTYSLARRARLLPVEQRRAITERFSCLLGEDPFGMDILDIVRRVHDLPQEERAQSSEMILQILRIVLG